MIPPIIIASAEIFQVDLQYVGRGYGPIRGSGWGGVDKLEAGCISYHKLTHTTSYRPLLALIIDGGDGNESPKSGGRWVFVGGGDRCNYS